MGWCWNKQVIAFASALGAWRRPKARRPSVDGFYTARIFFLSLCSSGLFFMIFLAQAQTLLPPRT